MDDILKRLQTADFAYEAPLKAIRLIDDAADEIARLREELEAMKNSRDEWQDLAEHLNAAIKSNG
jgi:hypothetical protein